MTKDGKALDQQNAAVAVMRELSESFVAGTVAGDGLYKSRNEILKEKGVVLANTDGATTAAKTKVNKRKNKETATGEPQAKANTKEELQQLKHKTWRKQRR